MRTTRDANRAGVVWMTAKYPGKCAKGCAMPIARGDRMVYAPSSRQTYHEGCASREMYTPPGKCLECGNGNDTHTLSCPLAK